MKNMKNGYHATGILKRIGRYTEDRDKERMNVLLVPAWVPLLVPFHFRPSCRRRRRRSSADRRDIPAAWPASDPHFRSLVLDKDMIVKQRIRTFLYCTVGQNSQEYRLKYRTTRSSVRSHRTLIRLLRTARSACAHQCTHLFTRSFPRSWDSE